jgi:hypothetical protein
MRKILMTGVLAFLALTGCSSDPKSVMTSPSAILAPIQGLKGKKVDDAIAYLGLPDGEITVAGRKVLLWSSTKDRIFLTGGEFGVMGRTFYCNIKAAVGPEEVITLIEIDTNSAFYCPRGK